MAAPKSKAKPIRIHSFNEKLMTTVVSGVGFRMVCECGAKGTVRHTWREARDDERDHRATHAAQ